MFQAIKTLNRPFLFVFFCFLSLSLFATEPGTRTKECSRLEPGVPAEFLLSRGLREQVDGFQALQRRKPEDSKLSFERSVSFLDSYHLCLLEVGKEPSALSAETLALDYLELGSLEKAWEWSEKAINKSPEVTKDLILLQTRIRIRQGELAKASDVLETSLHKFPNDPDFLYLLGNLNFERKLWNQSILYYTALSFVIERRDTHSKYKYLTAKALGELNYKLDHPKIAIKRYQEYTAGYKNDMEVLFRLAQIYFVLGDFKQCRMYLEQIREKNPRDTDASHMLAEIYFMDSRDAAPIYFATLKKEKKIPKEGIVFLLDKLIAGSKTGLETKLKSYIQENPGRLSPRIALLELAEKENLSDYEVLNADTAQYAYEYRQYLTAEKILRRGLSRISSKENADEEKSLFFEKISSCQEMLGLWNHAILSTKESLRLTNETDKKFRLRFRLAYLYLQGNLKKESLSVSVLSETIKENPNPTHYYLRGLAYFQLSKYKESVNDFTEAIKIDPKNFNYYFYRATAFDKLKKFSETESDLKTTISLNPNASNAMNYLGYLYAERDINPDEANKLLNQAISIEPDNPAFQDSLGWVLYRKKDFNRALLHLNFAASLALERGFEDPVIYEHLGDVYMAKKDPVNALQFFKLSESKLKTETNKDLLAKIKKLQKEISE
ncbi:tetratricopeptide repeat protein [Leptospira congkakensis]|uniref:Tetratricopeptide repeat protein n=1 Tax=Leptospira congkakensis TaxID=2484932 RepID=A0A4Z1A5H7_9LEPT|nr:tetratricopeptide repeat protein [Leptospira congkakensis]TGL90156.1 tetratricopeptide repeat protein [Leptospira congkakensis]TGL91162.1 tetratricopeptide repeat protein [Leptospira congkakensis]TGL98214.1 tetratricopeptide repeat protein [Leptospira congkakensis]